MISLVEVTCDPSKIKLIYQDLMTGNYLLEILDYQNTVHFIGSYISMDLARKHSQFDPIS